VRLTEQKRAQEVSRQVGGKPQGGRPAGGIEAASRELGVKPTNARRAIKIASIADEAKAKAKEYGIETQSALEAAVTVESGAAEV
jgi:hypothetical protein